MTSTHERGGPGLRIAATGAATPDLAWTRYTEPARWSQWAPHIRQVDYPEATVTPGTSGRVAGPAGVVAVFTVDAVDEAARTWVWSVRSGPLRLRFEHGVDPADGGSTAWAVVHGPRAVALGYAPVMRWSLGRLVAP